MKQGLFVKNCIVQYPRNNPYSDLEIFKSTELMIANLKCLQEIEIYIKIYNLYKDIKIILELNIFLTEHKFKEAFQSLIRGYIVTRPWLQL